MIQLLIILGFIRINITFVIFVTFTILGIIIINASSGQINKKPIDNKYCGFYKYRDYWDDEKCPKAERCEECPYKRRII